VPELSSCGAGQGRNTLEPEWAPLSPASIALAGSILLPTSLNTAAYGPNQCCLNSPSLTFHPASPAFHFIIFNANVTEAHRVGKVA